MSTEKQIKMQSKFLIKKLINTSLQRSYPAPNDQLNLRYITKLSKLFKKSTIGYSGHEMNLLPQLLL